MGIMTYPLFSVETLDIIPDYEFSNSLCAEPFLAIVMMKI